MLTIFKKLFAKAAPTTPTPVPVVPPPPSTPMPTIEVAHLSLAAITARFPDELKAFLAGEPERSATVALPLPTILKQLPTGSVKMSLASLQRQAHGLIKPLPPGDKRMVDVPLAEVFRHVRPHALRRRADQRAAPVPENGYSLFGDTTNPYAIAPEDETQPQVIDLSKELAAAPEAEPRGLKMDDGLRAHFNNVSPAHSQPAPTASASEIKLETPAVGPRVVAPPSGIHPPPTPLPTLAPVAKPEGPTLELKVGLLAAGWPDEIRAEIEALDPATNVVLPLHDVSTGLSKGRVIFSWSQIRAWLEPAPEAPTAAAGNIPLQLPLKIVAPAFMAASKGGKTERKSVAVDASIPSLFSDGRAPEPAPEPPPAAEPEPQPTAVVDEPEAPASDAAPAPAPAPALALDSASEPEPEPAVAVAVAETPLTIKVPETVGEIFGQPHKRDWTPTEMVAGVVKLPGVAGAIVALQEGLQVASFLPDGVKSEVVAAFLPQIFARLNQYSSEMKLGDVDDLLFTTHGAHCQIYRLGYVYLAILGKPGESLPWNELRLISEELARQTHK